MSEPTIEKRRFKWSYKGKTPEGNIATFKGDGYAEDVWKACDQVEEMMRKKWPEIQWMRGKDVEGGNISYGPTVQMLKQKEPK